MWREYIVFEKLHCRQFYLIVLTFNFLLCGWSTLSRKRVNVNFFPHVLFTGACGQDTVSPLFTPYPPFLLTWPLGHVSYCHHFSSVFCRPSVNISHFNLLLRNHWTNCNQTLVEFVLGWPPFKIVSGDPDFQPRWPPVSK